MNENSLKNLKPFQPGNKANPGGAVKLPSELRIARRENMAQLIKHIHEYVALTHEDALQRISGQKISQLEEMIQGQIMRAKEGDSRSFQFLVEVMCGKIPEADEHTSRADTMSTEEKIEALKLMTVALEEDLKNETSIRT